MKKCLALVGSVVFVCSASWAQMSPEINQGLEMLGSVEPIELNEGDVTSFIDAARELDEKDIDVGGFDGDHVPTLDELAGSMKANAEAMGVLETHGFTPERFAKVSMNVIVAMGALEMRGHQAEFDQALEQLETMKGQLPEEQYNMMREQMLSVQTIFSKAPAGNVALVEKHKTALESLGE